MVGVTRDKHALLFGAGRACPNGLNKARSLGRPPERPEVGKAARQRLLAFVGLAACIRNRVFSILDDDVL